MLQVLYQYHQPQLVVPLLHGAAEVAVVKKVLMVAVVVLSLDL
jgi:hypothetical protein